MYVLASRPQFRRSWSAAALVAAAAQLPAPRLLAAPATTTSSAPLPPSSAPVIVRPEAREPATLPRQFTVEVDPAGVLFADGTRLGAPSELERWAQRAVATARFAGGVVFGDPQRVAAAMVDAVEILRRAGFSDVRNAGRPAPLELSAARAGAAPVVSAGRAPLSGLEQPPRPRPNPSPSVGVATVGLHVDGTLNREPHRGRLVRVFERQFPAFQRCHAQAEQRLDRTSYGVDLLIPKNGGRPTVRQTRTRLGGRGFRICMQAAFEAIRFDPPPTERPEIVSYSLLFKPGAR